MKILFFGDVVGKIGREAIKKALLEYKKKHKPDLVIANGENLAHGIGITIPTASEMFEAGVNVLTTGNHVYKKNDCIQVFANFSDKVIRPANFSPSSPGRGHTVFKVDERRIFILNLNGRVFLNEEVSDPFHKFDEMYDLLKIAKNDIVVVDFHAEATSEKNAFGWYVDGRADLVLGTHTHIPTADIKIFEKGTGFVTDVGMVGAKNSVIGVEKEGPIKGFLNGEQVRFEIPRTGEAVVNAVLVTFDKDKKIKQFERVDSEVRI